MADIYTTQQEYSQAIEAYQWLIKADPKSDGAYKARARIKELKEKTEVNK